MIESITIVDAASYGSTPQVLDNLSDFNFVFGANGSGKTTIGRVVAGDPRFAHCNVRWRGGSPLDVFVYNQDFVERNLGQSQELKGVFTLGERQVETAEKIAAAKASIEVLDKKIEGLKRNLDGDDGKGGKRGELVECETACVKTCWQMKEKYWARFRGAMEGYGGSQQKFKEKVLQERTANTSALVPVSELEKRAAVVFGQAPSPEPLIAGIDATALLAHEANPILTKKVVGREDVDIAALIRKLGASDWVRQGRVFLAESGETCPFCQQRAPEHLAHALEEYFDETYAADTKAIDDLATNYSTDAERLQQRIAAIIAGGARFLDVEKMKAEADLLNVRVLGNVQRIASKKKESSQVVALDSLENVVDAIAGLIATANALAAEHNRVVSNLAQEKRTLTGQVWRLIVTELDGSLTAYQKSKAGLEGAIRGLDQGIQNANREREAKTRELRELEKQTTSIQPTIDAINAILVGFGFRGFSIEEGAARNSYRLRRPDGSDAKATLSEGERTFISFLYFYHLLKGSLTETGLTTSRVVVIDDPVSSLDADILFIVSTLIKGLFEEVRTRTSQVKQVFVLTHNVYFHKEVTFNRRRSKDAAMNEESFWVVRKPELVSTIERWSSNPVKTSYDLLWAELRREGPKPAGIQNTLRRILENYFKILGGIDLDELCEGFTGVDKLICRSLVSWVHDGSHFVQDDLDAPTDHTPEAFLRVFERIFESRGQGAHYRMMMRTP